MKKGFISLVAVIVLLLGGIFLLRTVDFNGLGATSYYTQIKGEGTPDRGQTQTGVVYERFEYELPGYDAKGKEKILSFTAGKRLREEAYLRVYVKNDKGVTSYEEVQADELPEKAAEMLK